MWLRFGHFVPLIISGLYVLFTPDLKRRLFPSFNPSGAAIQGFLMATASLIFGVCSFTSAAEVAARSSIDCRRDKGVVFCELPKVYPGGVAWTDRFQLSSAAVRQGSYWSRTGSRSYALLVLNSELEVRSSGKAHDVAERLNALLDGTATATGAMQLTTPWYGGAVLLSALALLLSGAGALLLWGVFSAGGRSPTRE